MARAAAQAKERETVRPSTFLVIVAFVPVTGCGGFSNRSPPGPRPIPEPWQPERFIREQLPRQDAGEVVLDAEDGLSPDEAALMAIDQNPLLKVARAEHGIGLAELLAAGVLPNPRIDGNLGFPVSGDEATVLGYGAGVSWNITPLFSRSTRVSAAEENLASMDLNIAWQEWQVAQGARLHTIRAIFLARRVEVAHELEQTWSERLNALRQARAQGAVTELEVTNAERSYADARIGKLELAQQVVAERAALNQAIGIDPTAEVALDLSFTPGERPLGRQDLLEALPRRRLDLLALQHAHRFHDKAARAAVIAQFPPVEIGFQAARDVDNVGSAGITLSFELPFFDRNQGAVARERALRTRTEVEYDVRLLEARAEVVRSLSELAIVRDQVVVAREASEAAARLAEQSRVAAVSGALSPLVAADILERAYTSRMRAIQIQQLLAELQVALTLASGFHAR